MKNLTACKDCGRQISVNADSCPHCGCRRFSKHQIVTLVIGIIAGLAIVAIVAMMRH
jgi:RNA polymerase subunit RPABC4/transcription elongation factor Spt4